MTRLNRIKKNSSLYVREVTTKYNILDTEKTKLNHPAAVQAFRADTIGDEARENFVVLGVNNKNEVLIYCKVSTGTMDQSIVHPREVFLPAILQGCSGIILAHNHPSGSLEPSKEDISATKRLIEAGKILGLSVLDHIIIGFNTNNYYSLKENCYI